MGVTVRNSASTTINESFSKREVNGSIESFNSMSFSGEERSVVFRNAQGNGTPINGGFLKIQMPNNAFITKVRWYNSGILTSSNNVTFQLMDGLGNIIDSQSGVLGSSWSVVNDVAYKLDSTKNTIKVVDSLGNANQSSVDVFVVVSYIGG